MNPVVTLNDLSQGVCTTQTIQPLDPSVLEALKAAVTTQRTVTTISQPVNARTIDNTTLGGGVENQVEFTFTNNTAVTIIYWFTALFNETGSPSDFAIAGNSAVDYPAAQGSGPHPENGGSDLRVFNLKAIANPGGYLIGKVEITTSSAGQQRNQQLVVNTQDVSQDQCNSRRLPPLCPACPNNTVDSDTWTTEFRCPLAVGGNMSFGYPVLAGETVTIRLYVIGEGVGQYKTVGGDCACGV